MDTKNLKNLLLQSHDFEAQDLDILVHSMALTLATNLCNQGLDHQVDFLIESGLSPTEILIRLKEGS